MSSTPREIGKQDPYCVVTVNGEKRRTKAVKRGGQHPEWDEEIRFTLFEDTDDVLARAARNDGTPPAPPPKDGAPLKRIKGGKLMKLACYADDSREPDLIGDTDVDLTEVLTKGETDEWFTLSNKDKFAGKVYLELTFWSNEPAPEKKVTPKPAKNNKQYGGPGSFVPSGERPSHQPRSASFSGSYGPQPDLYVAPYEQQDHHAPIDHLTQEFGEFGVSRRRESFPPIPPAAYSHHPQASYSGHISDGSVGYGYESTSQSSGFYGTYNSPASYSAPYDAHSLQYNSTIRGPRHSVPTASSGFVPLAQPSGFSQSEAYPPAPFAAPYTNPGHPQYAAQPVYPPQNPPPQSDLYLSGSASGPPYQGGYTYPQYTVPTSTSAPQQHYPPSQPPVGGPYQPYPPQPTHPEPIPPSNPVPSPNAASGMSVGGSRPLPPQPIVYTQPIPQQMDSPQHVSRYSPSLQPVNLSPGPPKSSHPLPIPPPPPPIQYATEPLSFNPNGAHAIVPPPPPPPPQLGNGHSRRRQSSLPQPPIAYHQHLPSYPPPPPPPAINLGQPIEYTYNPLPPPPPPPPVHPNGMNQNSYQTGLPLPPPPPPPNPPLSVGDQAHWSYTQHTVTQS